jgi:tRNA-modifying protein YgfZ
MAKNLPDFSPQYLPERAVISVSGDGAVAWLDNLVTCDLSALDTRPAYGALLTPQGKILHDMFILSRDGAILLDCARGQRDALLAKLKLYRLRAKLVIEPRDDLHVGVSLEATGDCYADPRVKELRYRSISASRLPEGSGYHSRRMALGLADSDAEIGVETHFPHEANFDQFGGVDFRKGCYVGQEVVSRMQHRGTARNRMLPVACAVTGVLMSGDQTIGSVLSSDDTRGIALVRIDRLAEANGPITVSGHAAHLSVPDWVKYNVSIPETAQ